MGGSHLAGLTPPTAQESIGPKHLLLLFLMLLKGGTVKDLGGSVPTSSSGFMMLNFKKNGGDSRGKNYRKQIET